MDASPYIGKKYNRLTIIEEAGKGYRGTTLVKCKCECGNEYINSCSAIVRGKYKSCGCGKKEYKERFINAHRTHGNSKTRLYKIFYGMKTRCTNPKRADYKQYGGKGIKICSEWLNDYTLFEKWAIENGYNDTLTIDRIDPNKDYSPENCRWVSRKEQSRNQERTKYLTYNGITKTVAEWAEELGVSYWTLMTRFKKGWSDKEVIEGRKHE